MKISVLIDNNAWNFFFARNFNFHQELPPEEFSIFINREVEIEIAAIPDEGKDGVDKRALKKYIHESVLGNRIATAAIFGFAEANPPEGPGTYVGFGQGTFQSNKEKDWYGEEKIKSYIIGKPKRNSGLTHNQADAAVAIASFGSVVLTCDKKTGPIGYAKESGGAVVFLSDELLASQSLRLILHTISSSSSKILPEVKKP